MEHKPGTRTQRRSLWSHPGVLSDAASQVKLGQTAGALPTSFCSEPRPTDWAQLSVGTPRVMGRLRLGLGLCHLHEGPHTVTVVSTELKVGC